MCVTHDSFEFVRGFVVGSTDRHHTSEKKVLREKWLVWLFSMMKS